LAGVSTGCDLHALGVYRACTEMMQIDNVLLLF